MLTLVMALAAQKGIKEATGIESQIKWPNDLVLNKKKICGILTEMGTEFMEIKYVVIGTGINVNQEEFPEELRKTATSLYLETGKKYHRSRIIERILEALEEYYGIFVKTEDMSVLLEEYNEKLVNRGQEVCVLDPKGEYRGLCQGITKTGGLLVELSDGTVTEVISGEVSDPGSVRLCLGRLLLRPSRSSRRGAGAVRERAALTGLRPPAFLVQKGKEGSSMEGKPGPIPDLDL